MSKQTASPNTRKHLSFCFNYFVIYEEPFEKCRAARPARARAIIALGTPRRKKEERKKKKQAINK